MRSDDDLLAHVRREAGARKVRRQRALVGATVVVAVAALGLAALAAGGGPGREQVQADDGGRPQPTTTVDDGAPEDDGDIVVTGPTTTTTTSEPATTTTSEAEAPVVTTTTAPPPIRPYSITRVADGITVTVEALQDRARPGVVDVTVRVQSDHGSAPGGFLTWGEGRTTDVFGGDPEGPMDCIPESEGGSDVRGPDPSAGPVDQTFTLSHTYDGTGFTIDLSTTAYVSFCTTDEARLEMSFPVDIGGA